MHLTHISDTTGSTDSAGKTAGPDANSFLTLLGLAASLAAVPGAAAAYDADHPYMDLVYDAAELNAGEGRGLYPWLPMHEPGVHSEEDVAAFMKRVYGMTAEESAYMAEVWRNRGAAPEGINLTVNGTVGPASGSANPSYTFYSTGRSVFNGAESDGVLTAFNVSDTRVSIAGRDIRINGSIFKANKDMVISADRIEINGGIAGGNESLLISSAGSITINGDIRQGGDGAAASQVLLRYYNFDYDPAEEYQKSRPYFKNFIIRNADLTEDNFDYHASDLNTWLLDRKTGSVLRIGNLVERQILEGTSEEMEPEAPQHIRINGSITVENNFDTANSVRIALTGNGADWSWKGAATMIGSGCANCALNEKGIYIYAHEGAVWQVEGADSTKYSTFNKVSSISRWTSYGPNVIDMTKTPETMLLTIDELVGSGTVIKEKMDPNHVNGENLTDMVVLGGRSRGEHTVELKSTGAEPMEITTGRIPYLQVTVPCAVSQYKYRSERQGEWVPWLLLIGYKEEIGSALKLATEENAAGGRTAHIQIDGTRFYTYNETGNNTLDNQFTFTKDFPELTINYGNYSNELDVGTRKYKILDPMVQPDGSVIFYVEMEGVLPDGTPVPTNDLPFSELSTGTELVTTLAGDGAMYSAWMADLSDLRKRLGEVRYGAQDGLWVKGIAQKDKIKGMTGADFKQKLYGLQLGLDHIVTQDEDRMWLVGANFKYNTIDQKVNAMRYGHGDLKTYGAFLYATYADYKGYYTDLVLSLDSYKQKMTAEQADSSYVHGKYNTWGWGASVEVGKMFSSAQDDEGWGPWYSHWWVEPQAQLAYYWVNGKKFSMDNGMTVQQKNGDSLIGRLGVVIGKKFNYGKNRKEVDKRYSQFYLKGGVKHEFLGGQNIRVNNDTFSSKLRGTRVYYGAGFDWNVTDQMRLYAQVERESGSKYKKDYEVSVGLKWQF
jgi:outer membrane autotransporter protein